MLMAVREKFEDEIDFTEWLVEDSNDKKGARRIAALLEDSVIQNGGNIEQGGRYKGDICVNIGGDSLEDLKSEL